MTKVGILGGGQLGRMLLECADQFPVETYVLENDENCPANHLCNHFYKGDINDFETVYSFGKKLDCITIEIEQVNVEALEQLESEGIRVIPKPSVLKIIRNKITQKQFYKEHQIPTPDFIITPNRAALKEFTDFLIMKLSIRGSRAAEGFQNKTKLGSLSTTQPIDQTLLNQKFNVVQLN